MTAGSSSVTDPTVDWEITVEEGLVSQLEGGACLGGMRSRGKQKATIKQWEENLNKFPNITIHSQIP